MPALQLAVLTLLPLLTGCTVVGVATTAVSLTASAAGLAASAAVGAASVVGKGGGAAANALSSDSAAPDHSGIHIRDSIHTLPPTD